MAVLQRKFGALRLPFVALILFLTLVFFTGGGSRADIQSLIILRPAAVIFCGIALWTLKMEHIQAYKFLFGMAAALFGLTILHLIPLPPSVWGALPGREIVTEIDKVAGLGAVWRPISLVPSATWNAFYSLFVPLAMLVLGVQLTREERFRLLPIMIGFGLLSGFWGLLQVIGDPQGPLYVYRVTNNGSAVGLFANRNHQAVLLTMLFPMLAVYASSGVRTIEQSRVKVGMAAAAGTVLVPLILVTGSRAGLIIGLVGLVSILLLYRKPNISAPKKRKGNKLDLRWLVGLFAVLCLGSVTILASRAEALQRLFATDEQTDVRLQIWAPMVDMAWKYFPIGSGIGSFVPVYQIDEPFDLLTPAYTNQAHNEFLEIYMTVGLPGLILLLIAAIALARMAFYVFRTPLSEGRDIVFARLGVFVVLMQALGSIADYPLRTPAHAALFVIALLWFAEKRDAVSVDRGGREKRDGSQTESRLVQA